MYDDKLEEVFQVTRPISPVSSVTKIQRSVSPKTVTRTRTSSTSSTGKGEGKAITSNIDEYLKAQESIKPSETLPKNKGLELENLQESGTEYEPYSRRDKDGYQSTDELEMYEHLKEKRQMETEMKEDSKPKTHDQERPSSSASHRKSVSFDLTDQDQSSVSLYEDDDEAVFAENFLKQEKLRQLQGFDMSKPPIPPTHVARSEVKTEIKNVDKPIKGILRSASPSSSSQQSTLEHQRQTGMVATWLRDSQEHLAQKLAEIEHENPFKKDFVSQEELREIEQMSTARKLRPQTQYEPLDDSSKIPIKKPVFSSTGNLTKPPVPPKPKVVKQAELVSNEAFKIFEKEMQQGDFVEYEHDPVTNTIKQIPPKSDFNPDGPLPPIPATPPPTKTSTKSRIPSSISIQRMERPKQSPPPPPTPKTPIAVDTEVIEILPARYEILPKMETAKLVHESQENSKENVLVPDDVRRQILLQENELRNALIDNNANLGELADTNNNNSHIMLPSSGTSYLETASQYSNSIQSTSGVFSPDSSARSGAISRIPVLNPSNVFPPTQILPVHYTQLPTPQQPGYYQTVPVNAPIQLCQAPATQVTGTVPVVSLSYPQSTYYTTPAQYHLPLSPMHFINNNYTPRYPYTMSMQNTSVVNNINTHQQHLQQQEHWNTLCNYNNMYKNVSNNSSINEQTHNTNPMNANYRVNSSPNNSQISAQDIESTENIIYVQAGYVTPVEIACNRIEVEHLELLSTTTSTGSTSGFTSPVPVAELTPINVRDSFMNQNTTMFQFEDAEKSPKMTTFGKETEV